MEDDWFDDSESLYPKGMEGPTIDPPSVDVPDSAGDGFQGSPIARLFLIHVVLWNAVVLLVSLGVMLIYFRSDWTTGGRLLAAGGILTVYGLYRWPRGDGDGADDADDGSGGSESTEPVGENTTDTVDDTDATDVTESPADGDSTVDS
jgi:hypothetical protein